MSSHGDACDTVRENEREVYAREVRKAADRYQSQSAGLDEEAQRELVDGLASWAGVDRHDLIAATERRDVE